MNNMENKSLLITGGAGFIGSHLVKYLLVQYPNIKIINLDALTYAGSVKKLLCLNDNKNYIFMKGNICDSSLVSEIFEMYQIDGVIHLAAESHVDNSIRDPKIFFETNVMGTQNLLENAKKHWLEKPGKLKKNFSHARFLHVSTDEVYGSLDKCGFFTEETPYKPNSPYSASKAGSDFAVKSYFHTYGLPVLISHCSNNFGPEQHDEKFIPTIIKNALSGRSIPIYGNGQNIRDWLYVIDHCYALEKIFLKGIIGENYNIGNYNEKSNIEITHIICSILDQLAPMKGSYKDQILHVQDRAGHDFRYAIDNSKICTTLGWSAKNDFLTQLHSTVLWYLQKYSNKNN